MWIIAIPKCSEGGALSELVKEMDALPLPESDEDIPQQNSLPQSGCLIRFLMLSTGGYLLIAMFSKRVTLLQRHRFAPILLVILALTVSFVLERYFAGWHRRFLPVIVRRVLLFLGMILLVIKGYLQADAYSV